MKLRSMLMMALLLATASEAAIYPSSPWFGANVQPATSAEEVRALLGLSDGGGGEVTVPFFITNTAYGALNESTAIGGFSDQGNAGFFRSRNGQAGKFAQVGWESEHSDVPVVKAYSGEATMVQDSEGAPQQMIVTINTGGIATLDYSDVDNVWQGSYYDTYFGDNVQATIYVESGEYWMLSLVEQGTYVIHNLSCVSGFNSFNPQGYYNDNDLLSATVTAVANVIYLRPTSPILLAADADAGTQRPVLAYDKAGMGRRVVVDHNGELPDLNSFADYANQQIGSLNDRMDATEYVVGGALTQSNLLSGSNIVFSTNSGKLTIHSTASGNGGSVAAGNHISIATNGTTYTISATLTNAVTNYVAALQAYYQSTYLGTATNQTIHVSNSLLQRLVLTNHTRIALAPANTNFTETIRLNIRNPASWTVLWLGANITGTNLLSVAVSNTTVVIFDHSDFDTNWTAIQQQ